MTTPLPYDEVSKKIKAYDTITILTHLNPDADTLGTALGIYALLIQEKGKKIEVVNASNSLPRHLDFLPNFHKIKQRMEYAQSLVISCDCGSVDRLGFDLTGRELINVDHHQSNTRYGTINSVIPEYASASQVAYRLFKPLYPMNAASATCFYTALLSDTRHFTTRSVNAVVFEVAQELVSIGAKPDEVAYHLTQRRALASLRILQCALATLSLHQEARIATVMVTRSDQEATGAQTADMEGIVEYVRSLVTVEIAVFVMELEEGLRVSLRSKHVDVSKIALHFGGGGHRLAAGFVLKQGGVQESIDTILEVIDTLHILSK